MLEATLRIDFISTWHVGSGLGGGHLSDAILARDHDGLPVLPGRAVKGALREGAWRLALCRPDLTAAEIYFWGGRSLGTDSNQPGRLAVSAAELPSELRRELRFHPVLEREAFVRDMTCLQAQTALTQRRTVVAHSLRVLECGIPGMRFEAMLRVAAPDVDSGWLQAYFRAVCAATKSVGAHRARGLGACRIRLGGHDGAVSLPPPCPSEITATPQGAIA